MGVSYKAYKVDERNFTSDISAGQKAIPVYHTKLNDVIDLVETEANKQYTTTGAQVSGFTITDYGDEVDHRTVIAGTFFSAADDLAAGELPGITAKAMGAKIFDFPAGGIRVSNAVFDLDLEATLSTAGAEIGLGTVIATGATAVLGADSTYEDIIDGNSGSVTAGTAGNPGDYQRVAAAETDAAALDGCSTAKDMYLNIAGTWYATGTYVVSGTISFNWSFLGDLY